MTRKNFIPSSVLFVTNFKGIFLQDDIGGIKEDSWREGGNKTLSQHTREKVTSEHK